MRYLPVIALLLTASPAFAASTPVPEPGSMALFGLSVLGVIVGREAAKKRSKRD